MKVILFALSSLLLAGVPTCRVDDVKSDSKPITHELFDQQLKQYVDEEGWVDYDGWVKDTAQLKQYLALLKSHHPNEEHWSREERFAYWINAYNAFTLELILDHWPVSSIKDIKDGTGFINSVWDIKFIEIEGHTYDLNNLEHGIIRPKFQDQRIHAAVNCASVSCPQLRNEAFTADRIDEQLDEQARGWFASTRNDLSDPANPKVSSILKWYSGDFEWGGSSVERFVEEYGGVDLPEKASLQYLDYDWGINAQSTNR